MATKSNQIGVSTKSKFLTRMLITDKAESITYMRLARPVPAAASLRRQTETTGILNFS
jgi:hypothetical protein